MSRISIRHSHPAACSVGKTLRRCRNNEEADNATFIDVDSEYFDNVIIIDVPESVSRKRQCSSTLKKDKRGSLRNVIYIDDDEIPDNNHSSGLNNVNFSAGTSSKGKNVADATPVRLSKGKRTYSANFCPRNRYGLHSDSESSSSDYNEDDRDCEIVEDVSGEVQEQWERAFSRRRKDIHGNHSGIRDDERTSPVVDEDHHQNVSRNDKAEKSNYGKDAGFHCTHLSDDPTVHDLETGKHYTNSDAHKMSNFQAQYSPLIFPEQVDPPNCEPGSASCPNKETGVDHGSSSSAFQKESTKEFNNLSPAFPDEEGKCSPLKDDSNIYKSNISFQTEFRPSPSFSRNNDVGFQEHLHSTISKDIETAEKQSEHSSTPLGSVSVGPFISKYFWGSGSSIVKVYCQKNKQQMPEIPSKVNIQQEEVNNGTSFSNIQQGEDKGDQLHSQNEETLPSEKTYIINEREKLKETEEYKRALEEEWASRQQALQAQAEEAQHLRRMRKRRKAESMRLLDMERRQKERIEEMRNAQKKDEENMNLKEQIRADVRTELKKLEIGCSNMASLLHLLGIRVGGWPHPLPQEVQTAYKRALLTFHPDRASKSDIRQQVEAEEKFKLINRLKEKFSPSL